MTPDPTGAAPQLVDSLARVGRKYRVARKLVVAPNFGVGRELLRRLSLEGEGWIGFEITTPARLAHRLARSGLAQLGTSVLDKFDEQALLDHALDSALIAERAGLGLLSEGVGFRSKVHGAIRELRGAGIGPRELDAARFSQWEKKLFLLRVLQRYERLLAGRHKADPAAVLRSALAALEEGGGRMPRSLDADIVVLLPGLETRGLTGQLVAALAARGAKVLETDSVVGLDVPDSLLWNRRGEPTAGSNLYAPDAGTSDAITMDIEFFRAASIEAELREVFRRCLERGLRWDQVEIIASDPKAYGSALHALSVRLSIPVTYAVGLPIARTRTGRVVQAYLDWIEEGFHAGPIRRLLEAGDLRPSGARAAFSAASLARRFRTLRIGWGRKRYRVQLRGALEGVERALPGGRESPEVFAKRQERARGELEALKSILYPALKATPAVPDRMGQGRDSVSPAEIARGLRAFLRRVPRGRGPDRSARDEVAIVLERVEATLTRRTEFRAAIAILRGYLDLRIRAEVPGADRDEAGAPWSSEGGSLHLADIQHGGFTGRDAVFLVGLDAERIPGGGAQDPVLLDSDRRVLGTMLPTSAERLRDNIFEFAALFARLRGRVTMSYGSWQASEARTVGPSSVLLQGLRLSRGSSHPTFDDLHEVMGRVVSAVPTLGRPSLDADDVWMKALGAGDVMQRGLGAVRRSYPPLDRGLTARKEREDGVPGAVHGVIESRRSVLDPRRNESVVVSVSRLEALGACPLRYLHGSILRLYPPDDPELDPDVWLDHRVRGSLLHSVFDAVLRGAHKQGMRFDDVAFEASAFAALASGVERLKDEVPIPGEGTLTREVAALREDVRSFVRMIRQQGPKCVALELKFGLGDDDPVLLELTDGTIRLRGAIDRVDADLGGFHVVDYKTGVPHGYGSDVFNGGRRLQHAVYAHVAEQRLGGEVVDGQYHFPTRRGQNQSFVFEREALKGVGGLLGHMLDGVAAGHFVPTNDPADCSFCDFSEICRVRKGDFFNTSSPLAEWSREQANLGLWPAFEHLKKTRNYEEGLAP
ncbi:MAG: PD-(D/E)XK nuclease family protein [Gemmatimonadetes bacterium]|nr:PD-(D/E)XK nuclease family protein [Gemmatimonadota bacterium]